MIPISHQKRLFFRTVLFVVTSNSKVKIIDLLFNREKKVVLIFCQTYDFLCDVQEMGLLGDIGVSGPTLGSGSNYSGSGWKLCSISGLTLIRTIIN